MTNPVIAAHEIAASLLAAESRFRRRRFGAREPEEMAVILELERIIAALRKEGVMRTRNLPQDAQPSAERVEAAVKRNGKKNRRQ